MLIINYLNSTDYVDSIKEYESRSNPNISHNTKNSLFAHLVVVFLRCESTTPKRRCVWFQNSRIPINHCRRVQHHMRARSQAHISFYQYFTRRPRTSIEGALQPSVRWQYTLTPTLKWFNIFSKDLILPYLCASSDV